MNYAVHIYSKNMLLKLLGKKKHGELDEFVQNIVARNSLCQRSADLLQKIDNTCSVERKAGTVCPNATEYFACSKLLCS